MIAKLKAFFTFVHGARQVTFMEVLMLMTCLIGQGLISTTKTIEAVMAGAQGLSYYHGLIAIGSFGWALELAGKLKKGTE